MADFNSSPTRFRPPRAHRTAAGIALPAMVFLVVVVGLMLAAGCRC